LLLSFALSLLLETQEKQINTVRKMQTHLRRSRRYKAYYTHWARCQDPKVKGL